MNVLIKTPNEMFPVLKQKSVENVFFKQFLKPIPSKTIDTIVHGLTAAVEPQIDCKQCANCCKKLEPGLDDTEIEVLADSINQDPVSFKREHVLFDGTDLFLKAKPCMFLNNCTCTVYQVRPAACAGFPHLNVSDIKYRRSFWDNYAICPIVFNVMEELKLTLGFKQSTQ